MLRNSIRQMLRTPVRTAAFLTLTGISALILSLGANLFYISKKTEDATKNSFTTIGMVNQSPSGVSMEKYWDPETQGYAAYSREQYDTPIPDSVLDIEGIPYIHKPKHQPFYAAYAEDYIVRNTHSEVDESWWGIGSDSIIAEMEPFEDCVPDHPVKLHFKKSLYGNITERMLNQIWFWDYENPSPEPLKAGKTYIMALYMNSSLEYNGLLEKRGFEDVSAVWTPWIDIQGSQYKADGSPVTDEKYEGVFFSEVTDGFYATPEGKRWLNIIDGFKITDYSIPVTPTDATKLLMYFYNGNAGISQGRDITTSEYADGAKVCLVDSKFAANNQLNPGDTLRLPLFYADYSAPACRFYPFWAEQTLTEKLIDAIGNRYEVFDDSEYTIAGIYQVTGGVQDYTGFEAPKNGIIIPAASVRSSDENNIRGYMPMKNSNTVFQIENGTMDKFWEIWDEKGVDGLEITLQDNGYSELMQSFQNTRKMSVILLGAGIGAVLLILLFFCHMFVTKQKIRTALERSLGVSRHKCRISLISGILLIVMIGVIIGTVIGALFTDRVAAQLNNGTKYSGAYSANQSAAAENVLPDDLLDESHIDLIIPLLTGAAVFAASFVSALLMTEKNLKKEPLKLLSEIKKE